MRIIRELPPLRGTLVQHVRRMVFDHEIDELERQAPRPRVAAHEILSAPVALLPTLIHLAKGYRS